MGRIEEMQNQKMQSIRRKKRIALAIMVLVGAVVAIFFNPVIGIVVALTPLIVNAMLDTGADIVRGEDHLTKKIKEEVAPRIIKSALPDSEYLPYQGITEEEYKQAEYNEPVISFKSDDKIITNTKIDNKQIDIEFVEVAFKKDLKDKSPFYGIFGYAKLPKDIRSKIKIGKEGTYTSGNIFKVEIDSKEFEDVFDVMAPNKVLSAKVITSEMINKMLEIYNTYGYMLETNIIRDKVYIRVASGPMIKETRDGEIIDRIVVDKHYNMLKDLVELIECIYTIVGALEL